jgi:RimJ/RimL family protein N-acetyltransferase
MKKFEPKTFQLKDGKKIIIRILTESDLNSSVNFFRSFSESERTYFRTDVTKKVNVKKRIDLMKTGLVHRIIATYKNKIIADGALEFSPFEWEKHIGEIRIIIVKPFQRKGLGMIMARELYFLAAAAKVEKIVVKMMRAQEAAKCIFRKLGFHEEVILPYHVKDRNGRPQDLLIMSIDMTELWKEMENYFQITDMRRHR